MIVRGLLILIVALAIPGTRASAEDNEDSRSAEVNTRLRSQFAEWIRANADMTTEREFLSKLTADMDRRLSQGDNIHVILDGGMTRNRSGRYVVTWGGQLHAFELGAAQCRAAGVSEGGATGGWGTSREASDAWNPLPYKLEDVRIEDPAHISGDKPIAVRMKCRIVGPVPSGSIVLRSMYLSENSSRSSLTFLDSIPADGVIPFSLSPLNEGESEVEFGPVVVVVDLLLTNAMIKRGTVASNGVGFIVDVPLDQDRALRAGLQFMTRLVDILATVKDEASAAQAITDYKETAVKNDALDKAMKLLKPESPEKEEALLKKYGPQFDALAARMQAEMTRLEQAPYAGQAFFDRLEESVKNRN